MPNFVAYIDMNEDIQKMLVKRQSNNEWMAIVQGDRRALAELQNTPPKRYEELSLKIAAERKGPEFGPRQTESFLHFVFEGKERQIEDAEADNIVYEALGEHRILGKAKKKKKKRTSVY